MDQDLSAVKYVGPASAKRMAEHGITSVKQLAAMTAEELAAVPGIGMSTAPLIIASARDVVGATRQQPASVAETALPAEDTVPAQAVEPVPQKPGDDAVATQVETDTAEDAADTEESESSAAMTSELSPKDSKKLKKLAKKAKKKAKKQEKEVKKAEKKAEKKAKKKAKKAARKAKEKVKKAKKSA